ncbi:hypothetical protein Barb6_02761 [Bacteroidales bacterium Barb6]|nr:hypothetical protein Barb6_02761 [Bacteroidales bacterium Barb6]
MELLNIKNEKGERIDIADSDYIEIQSKQLVFSNINQLQEIVEKYKSYKSEYYLENNLFNSMKQNRLILDISQIKHNIYLVACYVLTDYTDTKKQLLIAEVNNVEKFIAEQTPKNRLEVAKEVVKLEDEMELFFRLITEHSHLTTDISSFQIEINEKHGLTLEKSKQRIEWVITKLSEIANWIEAQKKTFDKYLILPENVNRDNLVYILRQQLDRDTKGQKVAIVIKALLEKKYLSVDLGGYNDLYKAMKYFFCFDTSPQSINKTNQLISEGKDSKLLREVERIKNLFP